MSGRSMRFGGQLAMVPSVTGMREMRNAGELAQVASLVQRLLLGQTTLEQAFPEYYYNRADWIKEREVAK